MLKTCISSYSFIRLIRSGEMTYFDVIDKCKEFGMDAVEFAEFLPGDSSVDLALRLREHAEKVGIPIMHHSTSANFLVADPSEQLKKSMQNVDVAAALGAKTMRHDAGWGFYPEYDGLKTYENALKIVVPPIRELADYAKTKGITTCSENHGQFFQGGKRLLRLVEAVDRPNYRALCDMGNFVCIDDDPAVATAEVAPVTVHVHVKDMFLKSGMRENPGEGWGTTRGGNYYRGTIIGHGDVPVYQCLKILKKEGYDRYVSIEFEGMEEVLTGLRIGTDNLKRFVEEIG